MASFTGIEQLIAGNSVSGYSMLFDGANEYVNIDRTLNHLATTTTGTWSCWVKTSDILPLQYVISFGDTDNDGFLSLRIHDDGKIHGTARGIGDTYWNLYTDAVHFVNDTWAHIAMVQNGTSPVIYFNGVAVAQTMQSASDATKWFSGMTLLDNGRISGIEQNSGGTSGEVVGNIDEVILHDIALSATEITELYNSGKPMNPNNHSQGANVVAWYRMGDNRDEFSTNWQLPEASSGIANKKTHLLDGAADYVNVDDLLTNNLANDTVGTYSCWVKPVDATPAATEQFISFGDADGDQFLQTGITTAGLYFGQLRLSAGTNYWTILTDAAAFADDTWTHAVIVQNATNPVMYIDGVAVAQTISSDTDQTKWISALSALDTGRIGDRNAGSSTEQFHFNGRIKEVMFFDTNFTAAQVLALYNNGSPTTAPEELEGNLVSWYRMGDAPTDSTTVIEDVKGSNNGTGVSLVAATYEAPLLAQSVNMEEADRVIDTP